MFQKERLTFSGAGVAVGAVVAFGADVAVGAVTAGAGVEGGAQAASTLPRAAVPATLRNSQQVTLLPLMFFLPPSN